MQVTKMVDKDVSDKIDITYIENHFSDIHNVGILYICTQDDRAEDDWTEDGFRYIVIQLPYKEVKKMQDARPLMLSKARERLGLVA